MRDVVTRTVGDPWLWLQEVTSTFFICGIFAGAAVATRRSDHLYLTPVAEDGVDAEALLAVPFFLLVDGLIPGRRGRERIGRNALGPEVARFAIGPEAMSPQTSPDGPRGRRFRLFQASIPLTPLAALALPGHRGCGRHRPAGRVRGLFRLGRHARLPLDLAHRSAGRACRFFGLGPACPRPSRATHGPIAPVNPGGFHRGRRVVCRWRSRTAGGILASSVKHPRTTGQCNIRRPR